MFIIDIFSQSVIEIFFEKICNLQFSCNQFLSPTGKCFFMCHSYLSPDDFMQHYFLSCNASCTIAETLIFLSSYTSSTSSSEVDDQFIEAANEKNLQLKTEIQKKIETIQSSSNNINTITQKVINKHSIIPKPPHYFSMSTFQVR